MNVVRYVAFAALIVAGLAILSVGSWQASESQAYAGREEVVFWHFWGGADRQVVEEIVARFNASQDRHVVRAIAMPGNNLDLKLFLAVTGGDPPDLVNQDDPIVADWAARGALMSLEEVAGSDQTQQLREWLVPAARRLGSYDDELYALCNGLDIRALYYNQTLLEEHGLGPPQTIAELDELSRELTLWDDDNEPLRIGYLPDSRRLWAWGIVFGGRFYDPETAHVTLDSEPIIRALEWMTSYRDRFGAKQVAVFRQGDQSLPGKSFPLLAGRYGAIMDGQWRVRDIRAAQERQAQAGEPVTEYGVCPLPYPEGGLPDAGMVNGNFFIVPRGSNNAAGAWEFMKFWSGFGGHADIAAEICADGGWIPVSEEVVQQDRFQQFLADQPLFAEFVALAAAENQIPIPSIPGAAYFQRTVNDAVAEAMQGNAAPNPRALLRETQSQVQRHLDAVRGAVP